MPIAMLTALPLQSFQVRGGVTYTSDANGLIASVANGHIADMLNAGCYMTQEPAGLTDAFGKSGAYFNEEGNLFRSVNAGNNPASTGSDIVMASYTLPANGFDISGRGLIYQVIGTFANNANVKEAKIFYGCTTANVGSAVVGGTLIADTGAYSTAGAVVGWSLNAQVFKYGVAGSNTQSGVNTGTIIGSMHSGMGTPVNLTATESSPIIMAFTLNCTTATADATLNFAEINALN